jgi:hypothetical protein
MPKTPVNEDHFLPRWKDEIGRSRQVAAVQAEAVTHLVSEASHNQLWSRVRFPDATHLRTDLFAATIAHGCDHIGHNATGGNGLGPPSRRAILHD